jgi:ABC-type nickel/cobalt efflux system permease component RcnA
MSDYLAAVVLGFSFGNLWVCALLVFSLQTTNRASCAGYLVGRIIAIILLSIAVAIIGRMVFVPRTVLELLSGIFLISFGIYLAATRLFKWAPPWKKAPHGHQDASGECEHDCHSCPTAGHHEYQDACSDCAKDKICEAEEPEVEPLTREARVAWHRKVDGEMEMSGFSVGMVIGALRGTTMCHKLVVLIPILLSASLYKALGLGLAFGLSSSIYPLIGFAFGAFALKLVKFKKQLFAVSCVLLIANGLYYLVRGLIA